MRRLLRKLNFLSVVLMLVGFVVFTIWISQPLRSSERHGLVDGVIQASAELRRHGPLTYYVALYAGVPGSVERLPPFPVDDFQPEGAGRFELSPNQEDGTRFFLLGRVETAQFERYCRLVALPALRRLDNGDWLDASTGKPLPRVEIAVGVSRRC